MPEPKRCGTCDLLERSGTPGLETYGKCPHRHGWVRTRDEGCVHHLGERTKPVERIAMIANGIVAALGLGAFAWFDVTHGNAVTHVILGVLLAFVAVFAWVVRRYGLLSEEPKYQVLEHADPPPEEDRAPPWWLDDR